MLRLLRLLRRGRGLVDVLSERLAILRGRKIFKWYVVTGVEQAYALCFVMQCGSHERQIVFDGAELSFNLSRLKNGVLTALRIIAGGHQLQGGVAQMGSAFDEHGRAITGGFHGIGQYGGAGKTQVSRDFGRAVYIVDAHASVYVQMVHRATAGKVAVLMDIHNAVNEALVGQVSS
ncbi:hypothetical protein PseAD21_22055 [Pseudomonas sp. AD21]|nr:hypothetical protein PseAD21_22055 [Pseudomonas sp. AD21]